MAEHFTDPFKEFHQLTQMLREDGTLAIGTQSPSSKVIAEQLEFNRHASSSSSRSPFANWWYTRDLTHVTFYSDSTFHWLAKEFGYDPLYRSEHIWIGRKRAIRQEGTASVS